MKFCHVTKLSNLLDLETDTQKQKGKENKTRRDRTETT